MTEYVNKAELLEEAYCDDPDSGCESKTCSDCDEGVVSVRSVKQLQAIEIVHCKDCKYWNLNSMEHGKDCHTNGDWFCADGERRIECT